MPSLPKDVKEAVAKCRVATQEALQKRISRMNIEFPVGTKFNVEPVPKGKKKSSNVQGQQPKLTAEDLLRSDRELARLFVDMFQPVGGDQITVVFNDVAAADLAKKQWNGDFTAKCRITSLNRRRSKTANQSSAKRKGFAAKLAEEFNDDDNDENGSSSNSGPFKLPQNTEVAMFVNPGPREFVMVDKICREVGMGTLVILLNARTATTSAAAYQTKNAGSEAPAAQNVGRLSSREEEEFEPVFHLAAAPQEAAPNCLLFRAYPGNWVMARKPAVGQPKPILVLENRPTFDECKRALDALELTPFEKGAEAALESVAGWFS